MKRLPIVLALPGLLAAALVLRPDPRGPEAAAPAPAEDAEFVQAAHESAAEIDHLLAARVALGCGNCLLGKARECEGPTAQTLLDLAVGQYRACLSYELAGPEATKILAEARRNLDATQRLLTRACANAPAAGRQAAKEPAPATEKLPPPLPAAQPPEPMPKASPTAGEPLMVGPDGVIYRRVGKNGR
jgi:hypothetical protein